MSNKGLIVRNKILKEAGEEFLKKGYSNVTMDEIAKRLGMSKKTLYEYFETKKALLTEVIVLMMEESVTDIRALVSADKVGFVDKLSKVLSYIDERTSKIEKTLVDDLPKNAPDVWLLIEEFREKKIYPVIKEFLLDGIKKGVIREEVNQDLMVLILLNSVRTIVNPQVLSSLRLSVKEAHDTIIKVVFFGILASEYKL